MKMRDKLKLSKYEKCLFVIVENVIQKITASAILYDTKFAYTSSYFLAVIAQEELAKLILLPISRELGELQDLTTNRRSAFYNHRVKQKIISTYGFFKKDWEKIEETKQKCLYVEFDESGKAIYCRVSKEESYKEIKAVLWAYQYQMKCISSEKEFSKDFIKVLLSMTEILGGCINDKLPDLHKEMKIDAKKSVEKMKKNVKLAEKEMLESLFKNPYELIRISKSALGNNHRTFLKKIHKMSFEEMVKHLGDYL